MIQHIVAIALVIVGYAYIKLKPPKEIEHIPAINPLKMIIDVLLGNLLNLRDYEGADPTYKNQPFIRVFLGKWLVMAKDYNLVKNVLMDQENFDKLKQGEVIPVLSIVGESIGEVDSEEWKRHKKVITPAFKRGWDINIFIKLGIKMVNNIKKNPDINILSLFKAGALDSLGLSIFNIDFKCVDDKGHEITIVYKNIIKEMTNTLYIVLPFLNKLPLPSRLKLNKDVVKFRAFIKQLIDEERDKIKQSENENDRPSLLNLLIKSSDIETTSISKGLSDKEIIDNTISFFIAGHESTAHSMSSIFYFLSRFPETQQKLRKEIQEVLGNRANEINDNIKLTLDDISKMIYLEAVITEAMRMLPGVIILTRKAGKDMVVQNLKIPKGQPILVNLSLPMREEKAFENADKFNPDRFIIYDEDGNKQINKKLAKESVAFGFGPRMCLGVQFTLLEQKVFIILLLLNFNIQLPANSPHFDKPRVPSFGISSPLNLKLDFIPIQ